jgi:hypothetical protein
MASLAAGPVCMVRWKSCCARRPTIDRLAAFREGADALVVPHDDPFGRERSAIALFEPLVRDGDGLIARPSNVRSDRLATILDADLPTAVHGREEAAQAADKRPQRCQVLRLRKHPPISIGALPTDPRRSWRLTINCGTNWQDLRRNAV